MIRRCQESDFSRIHAIINEAAQAYQGLIPEDCWKEPYMPEEELRSEIGQGVLFWGYEEEGVLTAVMGTQEVEDVCLIRHAYVCTARRNRGIGSRLLQFLCARTDRPLLVGTWAAATWAVRFYQKHGFESVSSSEKDRLLTKYWSIPKKQIESSVVLVDQKWRQTTPNFS